MYIYTFLLFACAYVLQFVAEISVEISVMCNYFAANFVCVLIILSYFFVFVPYIRIECVGF